MLYQKFSHRFLKCMLIVFCGATLVLNLHWSDATVLADQPTAAKHEKSAEAAKPANTLRLILPPRILAVPGIETNLYFDNVCLTINPRNVVFDVQCSKGRQQEERWTFTPVEADVGEFPLSVTILNDQNQVLGTADTKLQVVKPQAGAGREMRLLCIGDSLTHNSIYPERILGLGGLTGNPKLELIGSHWVTPEPGPVRHEGYGGWTALRFATHFTETARTGHYGQRGSPFLYRQPDGKLKLDFQQYCKDVSGGRLPTHVTIFLGPNDIFSYSDETIESGIDKMLLHYDQLLEMLRQAGPDIRIGVMLPVPPAATQDAFGANYTNGQTRWQYKRNQHRLVERMLEKYRDRSTEKLDVLPTYVALDCVNNYPADKVPANARNATQITRLNNGVHPSEPGYSQIADVVHSWIKATAE